MLIQIPYSLDELLATLQFLRRRAKAGQNWLHVLFVGGTDAMPKTPRHDVIADEFDRFPGAVRHRTHARRRRQPAVEPGAGRTDRQHRCCSRA